MIHDEHDMPALDPELADLIAAERDRPGPAAVVVERLQRRLGADIAGPGPWLGSLRRHRGTAAAFLLGCAAGAGLHAGLSPRPVYPLAVISAPPPPAVAVTVAPPAVPRPPPQAPLPVVPAPVRPAPRPRPHPAPAPLAAVVVEVPVPAAPPPAEVPARDADLAAERSLIEIARTAITRNRGQAALEALLRHEQQFPRGRLTEERESLVIEALVLCGRGAEARTRSERFRQRFPGSLLQPVVDGALRSIP